MGVLDSLWRVPVTVNHGFDRWCHPGGFVLSVMMAYRTGRYRIGREPNQCQEARHELSTERSHEPDCASQPPVGQASQVPMFRRFGAYYDNFSEGEKGQIESVAMDMWKPYISDTLAALANADNLGEERAVQLDQLLKKTLKTGRAWMIKNHLSGILNAIELGITNARLEGINTVIQGLKRAARGFRNRDRFRNAIYFLLGGLDLYPEAFAHSNP